MDWRRHNFIAKSLDSTPKEIDAVVGSLEVEVDLRSPICMLLDVAQNLSEAIIAIITIYYEQSRCMVCYNVSGRRLRIRY